MGGRVLVVAWFVSTFMIGIASSQWIQDIRIVDGGQPNEGRVEVLLNSSAEWGTVCDDGWGKEDAEVVCRQLGYNGVIRALKQATFGEGSGRIWIQNVACSGNETRLQECKFDTTCYCRHDEDASVICQLPSYLGCFNHRQKTNLFPHVRERSNEVHPLSCIKLCYEDGYVFAGLQFGLDCYCGRNDTRYDEQGPVAELLCNYPCNGDSNLLCGGNRVVGVFDVRTSICPDPRTPNARVEGDDPFIFGTVVQFSCQVGFGKIRLQCSQLGGEVKWIPDIPTCPDVRLVDGEYPNMGRVEVMAINGEWGTVCDDYWQKPEAAVVCRQLGYNGYIGPNKEAFFGEGTGQVLLDNADCKTDAFRLNECSFSPVNCGHNQDAGVTCQLPGYLGCFEDSTADRVLPFSNVSGPSVHALQCIVHCFSGGYVLAGVQGGDECYCGRSDTEFDRLGTESPRYCLMECIGNNNLYCGGESAIGVFNVTKAHCPDPGEPQGGTRTGNSFVFGSIVHFSCEGGFQLSGEPNLRCLLARRHEDETGGAVGWSSDVPQCIDTTSALDTTTSLDNTSALDSTTSLGSIIGPIFAVVILLVVPLVIFSVIKRRKRQLSSTHLKLATNISNSDVHYANVNKDTSHVYASVIEPTNNSSKLEIQESTVGIVSVQNGNERQQEEMLIDNIIYEGFLDDGAGANPQSDSKETMGLQTSENETSDIRGRDSIDGELYSQIKR